MRRQNLSDHAKPHRGRRMCRSSLPDALRHLPGSARQRPRPLLRLSSLGAPCGQVRHPCLRTCAAHSTPPHAHTCDPQQGECQQQPARQPAFTSAPMHRLMRQQQRAGHAYEACRPAHARRACSSMPHFHDSAHTPAAQHTEVVGCSRGRLWRSSRVVLSQLGFDVCSCVCCACTSWRGELVPV